MNAVSGPDSDCIDCSGSGLDYDASLAEGVPMPCETCRARDDVDGAPCCPAYGTEGHTIPCNFGGYARSH